MADLRADYEKRGHCPACGGGVVWTDPHCLHCGIALDAQALTLVLGILSFGQQAKPEIPQTQAKGCD